MDLKDKVITALVNHFDHAYVRLEDDGGITGFVVSPRFTGMPSTDRQDAIEDALAEGPSALQRAERSRVFLIAGFTPEEFDSIGTRVRVHKLEELAGGAIEVLLHGTLADAEYVRERLMHQEGIQAFEPSHVPAASASSFLSE